MSTIDFAAGGMPGHAYHEAIDALREQGPVVPVDFGGEPAWLITRHAELAGAYLDGERFPPGAAYRRTTEPAVGRSFISMDEPEHRIYRKLATPTFRPVAVARADQSCMGKERNSTSRSDSSSNFWLALRAISPVMTIYLFSSKSSMSFYLSRRHRSAQPGVVRPGSP